MKFGKTAQIILMVGIFAVALIMLYRVYLQQGVEQLEVNMQLATSQGLLPRLASEEEDLQSQLTQLNSNLAEATLSLGEAKERFPGSVESIEYDEVLFELAHECDLDIISLVASEPADKEVKVELEADDQDQEVDNVTYSVTLFEIEVQGKAVESAFDTANEYEEYISRTVTDILSYFSAVASGDYFTTATVELVNISVPEPLTDDDIEEIKGQDVTEEEMIQEFEMASAIIKLGVYSYEGE